MSKRLKGVLGASLLLLLYAGFAAVMAVTEGMGYWLAFVSLALILGLVGLVLGAFLWSLTLIADALEKDE